MENIENFNQEKVGQAIGTPRVEVPGNTLVVEGNEVETVDFYQPRTVVLTRVFKGKTLEFRHQTTKITNEAWLNFNHTLNPRSVLNSEGKFDYKNDEEKAVKECYRELVKEIPNGYQEHFRKQLTKENFYDLIPVDDQRLVLEEIFNFDVSESESEVFFFDDESNETLFEVDIKINGNIETVLVALSPKTKKDEDNFKLATTPKKPLLRKFRQTEVSNKVDFVKLEELFDKLSGKQDIPVWLKIGVTRYYFDEFGQSEIKK